MLLEDIVSIIIIIICLLGGYGIKRSSGTLIAGFELLPENRRQRLKENGFVKKRSRLSFISSIPFFIYLVIRFFVRNYHIIECLFIIATISFLLILLGGLILTKYSAEK